MELEFGVPHSHTMLIKVLAAPSVSYQTVPNLAVPKMT